MSSSTVDFRGYEYHPEVDMSNYIPIEKRLKTVQPAVVDSSVQSSLPYFSGVLSPSRIRGRPSSFLGLNEKRKHGRIFHRVISGVKRNRARGKTLRFFTLTSHRGYDNSRLSADLTILRKRIEHVIFEADGFNSFKMNYVKVTTDEGNGVIHGIYYGSPAWRFKHSTLNNLPRSHKRKGGFSVRSCYDLGFIPRDWLKFTWAEIIGNPQPHFQQVDIKKCYGSSHRIAGYLVQYVANQSEAKRMSWSKNWVYAGFVKDWKSKFVPRLVDLYKAGCTVEDEFQAVFRDWDKYLNTHD